MHSCPRKSTEFWRFSGDMDPRHAPINGDMQTKAGPPIRKRAVGHPHLAARLTASLLSSQFVKSL